MMLSAEDTLLLSVLRLNPDDDEIHRMHELVPCASDWGQFVFSAIKNGLGSQVYKKTGKGEPFENIPLKHREELKKIYYRTLANNMVFYDHFSEVIEAFRKEQFQAIPLKGIFLAEKIYHDIGLRQLSDIDLLIRKNDAEICRKIMLNMGYADENPFPSEFIKKQEKHLAPLVKNGVSVELHTGIHRINDAYHVPAEELWERARIQKVFGSEVLVLSPEDMLLHLCIHLDNHYDANKLQVKYIADIVNVLDLFKNEIEWEAFSKRCKEYKCFEKVFAVLKLIKKFCGIEIPEFLMDELTSIESLKEELLKKTLHFDPVEIEQQLENYHARRNIENIKSVKGFWKKASHLSGDVFPSRSFMCQNYKIKNKSLVFFYYPYRWVLGLRKMIKYSRNKVSAGHVSK